MKIQLLTDYIREILQVDKYKDYCPNGLQVEGRQQVQQLVTGVTASQALLKAAVEAGADAVLVHHGYFWRNEDARITGLKKSRIKWLLDHDINLFAYHLPLDGHAQFGNNIQLGIRLGIQKIQQEMQPWQSENSLVTTGELSQTLNLQSWADHIEHCLGRMPMVIGDMGKSIKKVAWCTGAAQHGLEYAIGLGVDAYLSGEISEQTVHLARESGVAYIAAGHHATERYGVQALGEHLAQKFAISHQFIDVANPV